MLLALLLLLLVRCSSGAPRFREAPQFYNSPGCPLPLPPASTGSSNPCGGGGGSPSPLVHIAMTLDSAYLRGSLAAIHSVLHHSSCPQSLLFHFLASDSNIPLLNSTVSSAFPSLPFLLHPFPASLVSPLISASLRPALSRPLNYARSYLPLLLPSCVPRALYLDSDLILLDDIISLAATPIPPPLALAAPQHCNANFTSYFTPAFWSHPSLPLLAFRARRNPACYFNTGVMLIDLARWRRANYTGQIEAWMRLQKRLRIYQLGSLPPFLLVFAGRIVPVDRRWNQHGLGGDNFRGLCRDLHPGPASLLHWSGKGKPWARIDARRPCPIDALWAPYDLLVRPPDFPDA